MSLQFEYVLLVGVFKYRERRCPLRMSGSRQIVNGKEPLVKRNRRESIVGIKEVLLSVIVAVVVVLDEKIVV